jgi:m7GpppX diphosphatase
MLKQGPKVIEEVYGVKSDQLRIFVHYHPQFYHFHVHFTRLENDTGCQVERAHLLFDIIQDLEQDPQCFQKRTIAFKVIQESGLHNVFREAKKKDDADKETGY